MRLIELNKLPCLQTRLRLNAMAIYHCNKSEVQRSRGQNAIAAIAYISRSKLQFFTTDTETGSMLLFKLTFIRIKSTYLFDTPTDNTSLVIEKAKEIIKALFKPGLIYKKVGICLLD